MPGDEPRAEQSLRDIHPASVRHQVEAALDALSVALPAGVISDVLLYGSAVDGGLRPDSDVDLLVVTTRRLETSEKRAIVDRLMPISGRATRPADWRPLEVTVVADAAIHPWRYPPRIELQYGEWLREAFQAGAVEPDPPTNPDLAVLLAMARRSGRALLGRSPETLIDPVPRDDLEHAMHAGLPGLMDDLADDTRNVLLTLARIWTTLATGEIRSKDAAAEWAAPRLADADRPILERARALYLAGGDGDWPDPAATRRLADAMLAGISRLG